MDFSSLTFEEMYQAVLQNNDDYDTLFFYAVTSTGIYCRPSCRSKAPKAENTVFFQFGADAQAAGYRPCKRCRSDLLDYQPMRDIAAQRKALMDSLPTEGRCWSQATDALGLSQKRLAEIFKAEYGVTPRGYVSDLRHREAQRQLAETDAEIIDIAYAVGFGSLSAFYKFFSERAGCSPAAYRKAHLPASKN